MRQFCSDVRSALVAANARKIVGPVAADGYGHRSSVTVTQHERGRRCSETHWPMGSDYQSPAVIGKMLSDAGYIVHVFDDMLADQAVIDAYNENNETPYDGSFILWTETDGIRHPAMPCVVAVKSENENRQTETETDAETDAA
jgi:hypothetical protein